MEFNTDKYELMHFVEQRYLHHLIFLLSRALPRTVLNQGRTYTVNCRIWRAFYIRETLRYTGSLKVATNVNRVNVLVFIDRVLSTRVDKPQL